MTFKVFYSVEVEATDAQDAAAVAQTLLQAQDFENVVLNVLNLSTGETEEVELEEDVVSCDGCSDTSCQSHSCFCASPPASPASGDAAALRRGRAAAAEDPCLPDGDDPAAGLLPEDRSEDDSHDEFAFEDALDDDEFDDDEFDEDELDDDELDEQPIGAREMPRRSGMTPEQLEELF